jgi:hypothetical protein
MLQVLPARPTIYARVALLLSDHDDQHWIDDYEVIMKYYLESTPDEGSVMVVRSQKGTDSRADLTRVGRTCLMHRHEVTEAYIIKRRSLRPPTRLFRLHTSRPLPVLLYYLKTRRSLGILNDLRQEC